MSNRHLTIAALAAVAALSACTADTGPAREETSAVPAPRPTSAKPSTPAKVPVDWEAAQRQLPTVDNTRIDLGDPSDVAEKFVLLSTTFAPKDVVDEEDQVKGGYPLSTEHYRQQHKPFKADGAIVRTRSWYNQGTGEDDPVVTVYSTVHWLKQPSPVAPEATRAQRILRSTQTPVTASGRELDTRTLDHVVYLAKQPNGTWLVDDIEVTEVDEN